MSSFFLFHEQDLPAPLCGTLCRGDRYSNTNLRSHNAEDNLQLQLDETLDPLPTVRGRTKSNALTHTLPRVGST